MVKQGDKLINPDGLVAIVIKVEDPGFVYYATDEMKIGKFRVDDKEMINSYEVIEANYQPKEDAEFY